MKREQKLRNLILDRYASLRRFAIEADIPYSTLMTLLSRDIGGASFDAIIRICRTLEIDPLELDAGNDSEIIRSIPAFASGEEGPARTGDTDGLPEQHGHP